MIEQWKPVVGYEARYEVSDQGRVRSIRSAKVLCPAPTSKGYLSVSLYDGSTPKNPRSFTVHSLVMAAFVGPCPEGMEINHDNAIKADNRLGNLEYTTPQKNKEHARAHGCVPKVYRGVDNANAKLTDVQVAELRRVAMQREVDGRVPRVLSNKALSRLCNVTECTIASVIGGKTYQNA